MNREARNQIVCDTVVIIVGITGIALPVGIGVKL